MSNNPSRTPITTFSEQTARVVKVLIGVLLWTNLTTNMPESVAQVAVPITSSGLNTQIAPVTSPGGEVQFNITGGTRPGGGANLFHSFAEFGVPTNNIANFLNGVSFDLAGNQLAPGLPTSNILGRVTGGNTSSIFGTIQSTGFGNANLFLMNPAGFLFGPGATVNVGGMVSFTSADYLKLTDNARFNAIPNAAADALLTASPIAAFGFLGSNPGAITVQGSQFTVTEGTGISLVGGNIAIQPGTLEDGTSRPAHLSALGGQINLASVASAGEVLTPNFDSSANMTLGSITLSEDTGLDVSANTAGTVRIRSGSFVMDNAVILADTVNANGAPAAIDINVADDIAISTVDGPALTARTSGSGDAGEVRVLSSNINVTATGADSFLFTIIDTHTSGTGKAGTVTLSADSLSVAGDPFGITTFFIDSGTTGTAAGHGGDITITAQNIYAQDAAISTGSGVSDQLGETATGSAGNLAISADNLELLLVSAFTDALGFETQSGRGGDISINARNITMEASFFSSFGLERGGTVAIVADRFVANDSQISTETSRMAGGTLTLSGNIIELTNGSSLLSNTAGDGNAGNISVIATDHIGLLRATPTDRPSGIFSNSFGTLGTLGNSGDIVITTPRLEMTGGARINTSTATSGRGGNVTINTTTSTSMSGETGGQFPEPLFSLGTIRPSGIFTLTIGGNCTGPCGNAGNVSVTAGSLTMGTGSQINSGTSSSGQGGTISINAGNTISMSGTLSSGQPGGIQSRTIGSEPDAGSGGDITLTAGQSFTISDGASVSASSTGPGNTGNIQINTGQSFVATNSSVTTQASQASGGAIKITTTPSGTVQLTNSTISASVLDGTGGGGSVNIDPQFVILQNSQILAQATQGPGGNIFITTNLLLPDAYSTISASSQFGVNGTVTIQSPNAPGGGEIIPLSQEPLLPTSLLTQRCAALAGGEFSSFTVAGRDSLPTEPGSWLASPLAFATLSEGSGLGMKAEGGKLQMPILSLRQIAPAGFLTQAFALDWSAGCQS